MRIKYLLIGLLALVLILLPMCTLGESKPGAPTVVPKEAEVDPGDEFELKVSVTASINGTHRVTFIERDRFSFPGEKFAEHNLTKGDAILFKVNCKVDDDAPDGDFNITFKVTWEYNGTPYEHTDAVRVTVGEGGDVDDNPCGSAMIIGGLGIIAFSVLVIRRRKRYS
ncbi:hypothetical protein [[Eubacterium] cellulosolvens]